MKRVKKTLLVALIAALALSVNVYAANFYADDFDDGDADDWTSSGGSWSVSNSGESSYYYQQTDSSAEFFSHGGDTFWADYSVEAKIKRIDTTGWGSCDLIGRRTGADFYLVQIGPSNAQLWNVTAANSWVNLAKANTTNALDTWYTYKLEMVGDVIKVYKEGIEIISVTDSNPILSGQIGFRTFRAHGRFDDVFVANLGASWPSGQASNPNPSDEETDVSRDVVLAWTPGESASLVNGHIVYFSEIFNNVNDGVGGIPQSVSSYDPGRLNLGTTYYWRVDEVNEPPDFTVYRGDIWSFTVEPFAYPIDGQNITATASDSFSPDTGPENTVNGSGMDANDLHSDQQTDMWMTGLTGPQPSWIQYEFDKVYKLHEMWVWNYNQNIEPLVGFGLKDVTIESSPNGRDWTVLEGAPEFAQAPGMLGYAHNTTVDFGGATAGYVKITVNDNWGSLTQCGLSEVRFFHVPVSAREPSPESGATDVHPDVTLSWRAGREAASHDLYLNTDDQAVINGTAPLVSIVDASYSAALDLDITYYWRIDEVNDTETPSIWPGDVWSFSTPEYLVVENFEAYNDIDPPDPRSDRIFKAWIDGFGIATNGALVGNDFPPYLEQSIVHGGRQSMPLFYSNTSGVVFSEATYTFAVPQDWTKYGIEKLQLWFYGTAGNTGQLYLKVNGVKIPYDGDPANLVVEGWQPWDIDLTTLGLNLQSVTTLAIGLDGNDATGTLYFDDIRLY